MANPYLDQVEAPPPVEYVKIHQIEKPQKTFFYRKITEKDPDQEMIDSVGEPDNDIFACAEQEAAGLDKQKGRFQQVGVSDGRTYLRYLTDQIKERGFKREQPIPIKIAQEIIRGAQKAELEVARGHFERPHRRDKFWGGASSDVANREEAMSDFLGRG